METPDNGHGLTLIHGPTGSGKSTLCDGIPWVLFGTTAKNGAVDEVLSWYSDQPATGELSMELNDAQVYVKRIRSANKNNDLYYQIDGGLPQRGATLVDTQRLLNQFLGFDETLYLSGAYFHEFSQVAQFFSTTAKARRTLTEQLVDLTQVKALQTANTALQATLKKDLSRLLTQLELTLAKQDSAEEHYRQCFAKASTWDADLEAKMENYKAKYLTFETSREERLKREAEALVTLNDQIQPNEKFVTTESRLKTKLAALPKETCDHCGALKANSLKEDIVKSIHEAEKRRLNNEKLMAKANTAAFNLQNIKKETNPYEDTILDLQTQTNSYGEQAAKFDADSIAYKTKSVEITGILLDTEQQKTDAELLADVLSTYRAYLIESTIQRIQNTTNDLISEHFDGEIRIHLKVEASDKLDVVITKDSNTAAYTQLSKGQRQTLKLAFGIAVMKSITEAHAIKFETLYFDEVFSGFDGNFKMKALGLLRTLSLDYPTIFFIEHDEEIKSMTENHIEISTKSGYSYINDKA